MRRFERQRRQRGLDILIATTLSVLGIAMSPIPMLLVAGTLAVAAAFALVFDFVKASASRRLAIT
jgi:H+-transporting ATPase